MSSENYWRSSTDGKLRPTALELIRLFIAERLAYHKGKKRRGAKTEAAIRELELIQILAGKPEMDLATAAELCKKP